MAVICPTVTAFDTHDYRAQIELLETFAERIHIDLMDGVFAPTKSPGLDQVWWPEKLMADIHLMYQYPMEEIEQLIKLRPSLVIIHFEADVNHQEFANELHNAGVKAGLAILSDTSVESSLGVIKHYDHALVFSGKLGYHGGTANLGLLDKVQKIKEAYPGIEIGWDGGVNDKNAKQLVDGGVTFLNVGGFIHKAPSPQEAYAKLKTLVEA